MPSWTCDHQQRHVTTAATTLAVSILLLAGCTHSPTPPAIHTTTPPTTQPRVAMSGTAATSTPAAGSGGVDVSSPIDAAEHWLTAYRSMKWTDGTPAAWIDRVHPYVTAALDAQDQQYRDGGGGIDWQNFVTKQCNSTVTDLGAVIPPESPGTATAVNVQVSGTVRTTCDAGQPDNPTETTAATLIVTQDPNGSWRVNQRLY